MRRIMNIDWAELREQKEWLLNNGSREAMGLVHLLDALQDDALDDGVDPLTIYGEVQYD